MNQYKILCLDLSRLQFQTLLCHTPLTYQLIRGSACQLDTAEKLTQVIASFRCIFLNPQKMLPGQLTQLLSVYQEAVEHVHAPLLLFTASFTEKQLASCSTEGLHQVDLYAGLDRTLRDTLKILKRSASPCWDGMEQLKEHGWSDPWYLLTVETNGTVPLEHDILALQLSYMDNGLCEWAKTIYIQQDTPISAHISEITGIQNTDLAQGLSRENAVSYLRQLGRQSPLILGSEH